MGVAVITIVEQQDGKVRVETTESFSNGSTVNTVTPNRNAKDVDTELKQEKVRLEENVQHWNQRIAEIDKALLTIPADLLVENPVIETPADVINNINI